MFNAWTEKKRVEKYCGQSKKEIVHEFDQPIEWVEMNYEKLGIPTELSVKLNNQFAKVKLENSTCQPGESLILLRVY